MATYKHRGEQPSTGGTGSWPEGVESQKVPGVAVTVGTDGEGEAVGNPTADPVPLTGTIKKSSGSPLQWEMLIYSSSCKLKVLSVTRGVISIPISL